MKFFFFFFHTRAPGFTRRLFGRSLLRLLGGAGYSILLGATSFSSAHHHPAHGSRRMGPLRVWAWDWAAVTSSTTADRDTRVPSFSLPIHYTSRFWLWSIDSRDIPTPVLATTVCAFIWLLANSTGCEFCCFFLHWNLFPLHLRTDCKKSASRSHATFPWRRQPIISGK